MASNPAIHGSRTPHDPNDPNNKEVGDAWRIGIVSDSPPKSKPQPRPPVVDTDILRDTGIGRKLSFSSDENEGDIETGDPGTEEKKLCELVGNCSIQGGKKRRRKSRKKRKKKKRRKTRRKRRTRKRRYRGGKRKTKRKN